MVRSRDLMVSNVARGDQFSSNGHRVSEMVLLAASDAAPLGMRVMSYLATPLTGKGFAARPAPSSGGSPSILTLEVHNAGLELSRHRLRRSEALLLSARRPPLCRSRRGSPV